MFLVSDARSVEEKGMVELKRIQIPIKSKVASYWESSDKQNAKWNIKHPINSDAGVQCRS